MQENLITKEEEARFTELCLLAFDFARNDNKIELEKMIQAGLNVNLKTQKGDTLLMLASYNNAIETTKMLIENGARVDERNSKNQTPLAGACFKGYLEIVKILVESGANINANNGLGATPYTFAIMFGRREVVKYLKEQNAKSNFFTKAINKIINFIMNNKPVSA